MEKENKEVKKEEVVENEEIAISTETNVAILLKRKWLRYYPMNSAAIFFFNSQPVFNYQLISVSPCAFK